MAGKIERETKTILIMVKIYCKGFHKTDSLCSDCQNLADYAIECVSQCPYGEKKPACGLCPSNCFRKDRYANIATVMRYAGPRMLYKHPILALRHVIDAVKRRD